MRQASIALALSLCAAGPVIGAEVAPPNWDISEVCQMNEESSLCPRVESDARRTLLDRWTALPAEMRVTCSQEVEAEGRPSYRKLASCINDLAFKAFDQQRQDKAKPPASTTH
jgi:hypothetical protein